jgi:hypothetical protein
MRHAGEVCFRERNLGDINLYLYQGMVNVARRFTVSLRCQFGFSSAQIVEQSLDTPRFQTLECPG